ncbi:MAG TPA: hypothetical protein VNX68_04845, partial [Nitrosopumilaceae archaeon]|nr:hypothetical protein [Nitrosopumilaceae archaeon]
MKQEEFIQLLENPFKTDERTIGELEKIIEHYPYFQTAYLLYAKALEHNNHLNYYPALKKTAVIAGDRTVLYHLITRKTGQNIKNSNENKPIVETGKAENIINQVHIWKENLNEIALIENINFVSYYDKPEQENPFTFIEAEKKEDKEEPKENSLKITSADYSQNPEN